VFVAEDNEHVLDLLVTRLQMAGYAISSARDGVRALTGIESSRPAAVILDINMPGLDGFEVLRILRSRPQTASTPVMMLTVRNSVADVQRAIGLGTGDYMTKPFDDRDLLARVARLVRRPEPATH
jgi:DNA-binding response OmpR family regulator